MEDLEVLHPDENEALAQAHAEGLEFVDEYTVSGDKENTVFKTRSNAEDRAKELKLGPEAVIQTRRRK